MSHHNRVFGLIAAAALAVPASHAGVLYSDGPPNGDFIGTSITGIGAGADSFTLSSSAVISGADFTAFMLGGSTGTSVDWAILDGLPGLGTVLFSGTATQHNTFLFDNNGTDFFNESLTLGSFSLGAGTYWFELSNATFTAGFDEAWDINGGPSHSWNSLIGGDDTLCDVGPDGRCSNIFDITGTASPVPEPSSLGLLAAALVVIRAMSRRKMLIGYG